MNSNTTQNDLLSCIKDFIQSEIVNDIQNQTKVSFFEISADKVTDEPNWEQLGIVVCYVRNCQTIEKLLECDDIKGASIVEFIINSLINAGLNPQMCWTQTFCSKTGIKKPVYFHSTSDELNLFCLKHPKSCKLWMWLVWLCASYECGYVWLCASYECG